MPRGCSFLKKANADTRLEKKALSTSRISTNLQTGPNLLLHDDKVM